MAIPFFMLVGSLMERGGIAKKLVDVAEMMTGTMPGGLGMACLLYTSGGLEMKAQIDKETAGAGLLKKGVRMQVKLAGQSKKVEAEVESVDQMAEDGKIQVTAWIQEGEGRLGDLVSFTVNMESGAYPVSYTHLDVYKRQLLYQLRYFRHVGVR